MCKITPFNLQKLNNYQIFNSKETFLKYSLGLGQNLVLIDRNKNKLNLFYCSLYLPPNSP